MRTVTVSILLFATVIFQHLQLGLVLGYPITLGFITGVLMVIVATERFPVTPIVAAWSIIVALSAFAALLAGAVDSTSYFGTLALFIVTSAIVISAGGTIRSGVVESKSFARALYFSLLAVVILSVGQVALGKLGSAALFNPFGRAQYYHEYDPQLDFAQYPRAQGFFLEPSYDAFVIGALTVALVCLKKYRRSSIVLGVVGLVACQSATALLLMVLILVLVVLRARPATALIAVAIAIALFWYSGDYLSIRLSTLTTEGSSAYYRIFAPLPVLVDVLGSHPFGMPLGSVAEVIYSYRLNMAGVRTSSLDNGFYVVVFYFGWIGVFALIALLVSAISTFRKTAARDRSLAWIAPIWLVASLAFSGAIMAPEFGLMTWIVLVALRSIRHSEKVQSEFTPKTHQHRRGYIPRSGGIVTHAALNPELHRNE